MYKEVDENTSSRKTLFATNITNLGVHATLMNNVVYPKSLLVRKWNQISKQLKSTHVKQWKFKQRRRKDDDMVNNEGNIWWIDDRKASL